MAISSQQMNKNNRLRPADTSVYTRQRLDETIFIPAPCRRLNSLALFCESSTSPCAAAVLINGCLIITSNDLFKGSTKQAKDNKTQKLIKKVLQYFFSLQSSNIIQIEEKERIFKKVFIKTIYKLKKENQLIKHVSMDLVKEIFVKLWNITCSKQTKVREEDIETFKEQLSSDAKSVMCSQFNSLLSRFGKLEESCKNDQFTDPNKLIKWSSKKISEIEEKQGVHAEVQQLSLIIKGIMNGSIKRDENVAITEIYIGVSKLCCSSCRLMVEAANEVICDEGFKIIVRGKHDYSFDKNWKCPDLFARGYEFNSWQSTLTIADEIGFLTKKKILKMQAAANPSDVNMNFQSSSSSPATSQILEDALFDIESFSKSINIINNFIKLHSSITYDDIANSNIPLIMKLMLECEEFIDLNNSSFSAASAFDSFFAIYKSTNELFFNQVGYDIDKELFLCVLKTEALVGNKICNLFTTLSKEDIMQQTQDFAFTSGDLITTTTTYPLRQWPTLLKEKSSITYDDSWLDSIGNKEIKEEKDITPPATDKEIVYLDSDSDSNHSNLEEQRGKKRKAETELKQPDTTKIPKKQQSITNFFQVTQAKNSGTQPNNSNNDLIYTTTTTSQIDSKNTVFKKK